MDLQDLYAAIERANQENQSNEQLELAIQHGLAFYDTELNKYRVRY